MIIIPELETIVILVPRTGTTSLKKAIKARYPEAMALYRHMEADGVPGGYDQWHKVGVVRDPLERLWSLYKYLQTFDGPYPTEYIAKQRASVDRGFDDWILNNEIPFTHPYDSSHKGKFYPGYMIRHNLPENRKSQKVYLRPDLGTNIWQYTEIDELAYDLDIKLDISNQSMNMKRPIVSNAVKDYINRAFAWDISVTKSEWALKS